MGVLPIVTTLVGAEVQVVGGKGVRAYGIEADTLVVGLTVGRVVIDGGGDSLLALVAVGCDTLLDYLSHD